MPKTRPLNEALSSLALSHSPQMPVDPRLGSLLSEADIHIPQGVEVISDTHFRVNFHAPTANEVALRTFTGKLPLERQENGVWTTELEIGQGGMRPLFFLVDGVSVLNPMAPIGFGASVATNIADLPQAGEDFYYLKDVPHGAVSREYYRSSVTGRYESCLVYTPPGYMNGGAEQYPVLYLQHGHGENEQCWVYQGKVNFIMDNLIAQQKARPCIIVMNNGMVQQYTDEGRHVNALQLEHLLVKDCIPFIEKTYRVKTDRQNRAMAGLSMGSMQTSMTTLANPELFAWAGVFSGFVQPLPSIAKEREYLSALDDAQKFCDDFRLFFRAIGTADPFLNMFEQDSLLMEQKGLSPDQCSAHIIRTYPGSHDWNVWRRCVRDFLSMLFV